MKPPGGLVWLVALGALFMLVGPVAAAAQSNRGAPIRGDAAPSLQDTPLHIWVYRDRSGGSLHSLTVMGHGDAAACGDATGALLELMRSVALSQDSFFTYGFASLQLSRPSRDVASAEHLFRSLRALERDGLGVIRIHEVIGPSPRPPAPGALQADRVERTSRVAAPASGPLLVPVWHRSAGGGTEPLAFDLASPDLGREARALLRASSSTHVTRRIASIRRRLEARRQLLAADFDRMPKFLVIEVEEDIASLTSELDRWLEASHRSPDEWRQYRETMVDAILRGWPGIPGSNHASETWRRIIARMRPLVDLARPGSVRGWLSRPDVLFRVRETSPEQYRVTPMYVVLGSYVEVADGPRNLVRIE